MNKKALYESIMKSVAKEVKKALNESSLNDDRIIGTVFYPDDKYFAIYNNNLKNALTPDDFNEGDVVYSISIISENYKESIYVEVSKYIIKKLIFSEGKVKIYASHGAGYINEDEFTVHENGKYRIWKNGSVEMSGFGYFVNYKPFR